MQTFQRLIEVKACAAFDNVLLVMNICVNHFTQIQNFRLLIHKSNHNCAESFLHLSIVIQIVKNNVCVRVALYVNYKMHVCVGLIAC